MRLEKVVLNGFKSFADKTEFSFNRDITAIVGPNGCGKSNVVDAIKWVLGNQSPKALRSGHMTDVIFSGSGSRKPSGMAQVQLHFSQVTGQGLENDELVITRRLYKSGESLYQINNSNCRLKDIREMFMDTGVGVSAYSIIEQGQIDQLLHASKADRRIIFEEAAGISKFKAHKKEALRKLDRTDQNLLRLADIVNEVQKQLRSIKLQAGKARNYLQYSDRLKELRVNFSLSEYDKIVKQTKKKNEKIGRFKELFAMVVNDVARNDAEVSELGKSIIETEGHIGHWDNALVAAKSKIDQHLERIDYLKSRGAELVERKVNAASQITRLEDQMGGFSSQLATCKTQLQENEELFEANNKSLDKVHEIIHEINVDCGSIQTSLEDEKSGIIDIVRRTAQLHNVIESMSTYRERMADQKDRLSGRADDTKHKLAELLTSKATNNAKLAETEKVIAQLQAGLDDKRAKIADNDSELAEYNDRLAEIKEKRSGLQSEINVISDMESKREGLSKSIRNILDSSQNGDGGKYDYIEGIVADIISADAKYAVAVEAALEGMTDALVINSTSKFIADQETYSKLNNRINLLLADKIAPFADNADMSKMTSVKGRVVEFVKFDSRHASIVWQLLGKTILVDSIDDAIEVSHELGAGYRFVTANGEVFDGAQRLRIGPVGKTTGLISRKSRLTELENLLAGISVEISSIDKNLQSTGRDNEHLAALCKDFRTSIYEANTEKVDAESKLRVLEENIKRLSDEEPMLRSEIDTLDREISESVQKEYDSRQKLQELEAVNTERNSHIDKLEEEFAHKKEHLETHIAEQTELKVHIGQVREQRKSIQQRTASLQSQLQHARIALESSRTDLLGCDEQVLQTQRNILTATSTVSQLYVDKEKSQKKSTYLHARIDEKRKLQRETESTLRQKRTEQAEVEQQMHSVELDLSQLTVKNEDLTQRVSEELGLDLAEAYQNFEELQVDWNEVRDEIKDLRGKISRLGNVNVDAIEELQELEDRYEFLSEQVEDLNESKLQLEQLINKINKESREKFVVTFEEVRKNFQILFRKLFGGGKADILLEDPDDVLESGIEIMAKPPGKETRSISLLSGGEKTLTAMGLLFAVFKSKPSPFCILDEVDAALDEANNERFNMIVQEFRQQSQFVIITHSKRTMSIAEVLFGVTMQTRGVSKKISVQFDGVDSDSDIDTEPDAAVA
ncbi:MAG: chromosome segregation protein SMC [Planctomycetes bacterium]|nr:chromosome segregation protein SMC [Planctomycetota bacterium]